ncbi:ATP-binding cassette domain-containing protein, partial [Arthrospira platensis SPKY1]|nr:ATP-binding cassette domain-containing protein [Arthrospira platensis SPKY1]
MSQIIARLRDVDIYQKDQLVLSQVNLTLNMGEFVYLIGKTGSGKSSLLKTLYAALPLAKGAGEVAGFDLNALTRKTIPLMRRKLGI